MPPAIWWITWAPSTRIETSADAARLVHAAKHSARQMRRKQSQGFASRQPGHLTWRKWLFRWFPWVSVGSPQRASSRRSC